MMHRFLRLVAEQDRSLKLQEFGRQAQTLNDTESIARVSCRSSYPKYSYSCKVNVYDPAIGVDAITRP